MNRKHTPGPWRRHEKTEGCDSGTVLAGYNKIVALVSDRPEQEANARLIAQVPELLLIAIAYRNLLKTMAHTEEEVATFNHINAVIAAAGVEL